jgi:cysteinyl-tRNA synthetase
MLRLHDTAVGQAVELEPRRRGEVAMYICGPTVYDVPHLGHGRFALVFDVLRRYLEWSGMRVTYVSNVTDIDDKIIKRAHEEDRSTDEVTAEYEQAYYRAMDGLGVRRPDVDPHATAYVEQMVELVSRLVDGGSAYEASDGVYFSVDAVDDYGLLARQPLDTLRAGARVEVDEQKRSPLDFALWKLAKPGEPSWPSPWGEGRPGWHTECVVMSLDLLGEDFDLHGGGQDLIFPHHENERAQAVAAGRTFARHWAHNGFVEVSGEKMSKSLGNFTTLDDLLEDHDARAYRLLVLQSHYRAPVEVTPATVEAAERTLAGLDDFSRRAAALGDARADADVVRSFAEHMDDDLDTPAALARLFEAEREANRAMASGDTQRAAALAAAVREAAVALGLELAGTDEIPGEVLDLVRRREEARGDRNFAAADSLRDDLSERGWAVEDTPQGPRVHRKR